jgi:hypothetical protein
LITPRLRPVTMTSASIVGAADNKKPPESPLADLNVNDSSTFNRRRGQYYRLDRKSQWMPTRLFFAVGRFARFATKTPP